jgi:hypothetical protein
VAVIVTVPPLVVNEGTVTSPSLETDALKSDEVHAIEKALAGSSVPSASFSTAVSCCELPAVTVAVAGVTVTEANGFKIVIVATALFPSLVTVTVTVPAVAVEAT